MDPVVPVIETARLRLRGHRVGDFDACAAMWADPRVTRWIGGKPATKQEVWSKILRYAGLWSLLGYGYWAIEEAAGGTFVGELGFADFKRTIEPPIDGVPEAGWAIVPSAHGRGYATEALGAIVAWADANLSMPRTVCIIGDDNAASIRVAQKCGYREATRTTFGGTPTTIFERPA